MYDHCLQLSQVVITKRREGMACTRVETREDYQSSKYRHWPDDMDMFLVSVQV